MAGFLNVLFVFQIPQLAAEVRLECGVVGLGNPSNHPDSDKTKLCYNVTQGTSLSSDKCTYWESLWIKASDKCPQCECKM